MRLNRYSPRTEEAYVDWIKRFIRFHRIRHPQEMGADEVKAFLSHLATEMNVAASTLYSGSPAKDGADQPRQSDARRPQRGSPKTSSASRHLMIFSGVNWG